MFYSFKCQNMIFGPNSNKAYLFPLIMTLIGQKNKGIRVSQLDKILTLFPN